MKFFHIVLLLTIVNLSLSVDKKKNQKFLSKEVDFLPLYCHKIFDKINEYRSQNGYGAAALWDNELKVTAQEIISQQNFGQHANFDERVKKIANEYFSEISMKAHLASVMPDKDIFAEEVIKAISEGENVQYLQHEYSHGAVAIQKDGEDYLIIIHLMKERFFDSCRQAKQLGFELEKVKKTIDGQDTELQCDQITLGGGWSLIADVDQQANAQKIIIPISDKNLHYTELLWVKKPGLLYGFWGADQRKGFDHGVLRFRFDDSWNEKFDYEDLENDGEGTSKVLFKNLPANKKITGFSDVESIAESTLGDNHYDFKFKLYVR